MRAVVQRVAQAGVSVAGETVGEIGGGLLFLLAVGPADDAQVARHLAGRVASLRVFPDSDGRMNRSLLDAQGEALVVSQFTLYADARRGHRPSFVGAGPPVMAAELCSAFAEELRALGVRSVAEGRFGAHMEVSLVNDGPVTLVVSVGEPIWETDCG